MEDREVKTLTQCRLKQIAQALVRVGYDPQDAATRALLTLGHKTTEEEVDYDLPDSEDLELLPPENQEHWKEFWALRDKLRDQQVWDVPTLKW